DPPAQALAVGNAAGGTLAGPTAAVSYGANEPTGWLAAVARDGAAPTVEIAVRVAGLPVGVYTAGVDVGSSLPGVAARRVPVVLAVAPPPSVVLSEAAVAFGAAPGGTDPAAQAVAVTNGGGGSLGGLSAAAAYAPGGPSGWLAVALGGTPASSTLTLRARTGSLPEGEHTARVTVAASAAGVPPAVLLVTFGVHSAPAVLLQPADVSFEATENGDDPAPAVVGVANGGGGSLTGLSAAVAYGTGAGGWLGATLGGGGTAPATLTLTPHTGTLAAGTRAATVTVASSVPGVPAASVSVRFTVAPTPVIHLSSTAAAFTASVGGGDPQAQTFSVTEPLNAPLPGLAVAPVEYPSGGPAGWLTARLADAPRVLTLEARTAGLGEGAYTASVVVRSPQRGVQEARMAVTLRVGSAPVIRLSANVASFPAAAAPRNVVVLGLADGSPAAGLATTVDYGGGEKGWLVASADSAAKQVRLQVSAGSLPRAAAPHRATVAVTGRPGTVPDTVVVTYAVPVSFAASVLPRFKASCEGCHTTGSAAGNLDLSAAAAFRDLLAGQSTHAGNRRVTPFDPGADSTVNLLLCVLDSPCTRSRDHSKGVPAGLRDTLELWIREGAPDN
ncbi:MAG TPA: hypothetical protein VFE05_21530, partial [Longimicrobiaceae bacterium]|nr:hypothetical protein [Longimicrobiaceae bacterium]